MQHVVLCRWVGASGGTASKIILTNRGYEELVVKNCGSTDVLLVR